MDGEDAANRSKAEGIQPGHNPRCEANIEGGWCGLEKEVMVQREETNRNLDSEVTIVPMVVPVSRRRSPRLENGLGRE